MVRGDIMIHLISPQRVNLWIDGKVSSIKPSTIVQAEDVEWADAGLRERLPNEIVHLREEMNEPCQRCGISFGVWTDVVSTHAMHPNRCTD